MERHVHLIVNERVLDIEVRPCLSLLQVLRDDLNLTGAKYGGGQGACGTCTVVIDGVAVPSCRITAEETAGKSILMMQGLARNGSLLAIRFAMPCSRITARSGKVEYGQGIPSSRHNRIR